MLDNTLNNFTQSNSIFSQKKNDSIYISTKHINDTEVLALKDTQNINAQQQTKQIPAGFGAGFSYGMYDYETNGTKNIFYYANKQNIENGYIEGSENENSLLKEAFDLLFQGGMKLSDLLDTEHFGELFTKEFSSKAEILDFAKKLGDDRATWIDSVKQPNIEDIVVDMSSGESARLKRQAEQNAKNTVLSEQEKADEIERNNRMLMRKYNGAKSRNLSLESKNELLKTFFEEFLKNNNPLKFLEFMKKTDIKA